MLGLLSVADGIGGHKAGDIASNLALKTIFESMAWFLDEDQLEDTKPMEKPTGEFDAVSSNHLEIRLLNAVKKANLKVYEYGRNNPDQASNMGTTITCALISDNDLVVAHVGDSRAYILRKGNLRQITEDHSFVGQLVRDGQLPPEAYYMHPRRNVITRALGQFPDVKVDISTENLKAGDKVLICSDGLWEMIRDPNIRNYLKDTQDLEATVNEMVKEAISQGGPDNISIIIGEILAGANDS